MTNKDDAIQLKLKKARSFMDEVDFLVNSKFYLTAINRLYYSCFHATKALLLTKDLVPKTHSGVITMLNHEFVSRDLFDKSQAAFFSKLMQERIDDDYSDYLIVELDEIIDFIEPSKEYLRYVESLISSIQN